MPLSSSTATTFLLLTLAIVLAVITSSTSLVVSAQQTTMTNTTSSTLTPSSTTSHTSEATTSTTVDPASTTATFRVPPERSSNTYILKLSGNDAWKTLLNNSYDDLRNSVTIDLAVRFHTEQQYIYIKNMTIGSLIVDFSVFPEGDGSQIRESDFLNSAANQDSSWLKSTQTLYQGASGGVATTVSSSSYANSNQTSPPLMTRCADGCTGALAASGAVVAVICIFVALAWLRYSKRRDAEERSKLGIVSAGDFPEVTSSSRQAEADDDEIVNDDDDQEEMVIPQRRVGNNVSANTSRRSNYTNNNNNTNNHINSSGAVGSPAKSNIRLKSPRNVFFSPQPRSASTGRSSSSAGRRRY